MKAPKFVIMAVALVASVALALTIMSKTSQASKPQVTVVSPQVAMAKVLVAARDLKPGQVISETDLIWADWPQSAVSPAYQVDTSTPTAPTEDKKGASGNIAATIERISSKFSTPINFVGGRVRDPIMANEPILANKIVRTGQGGFLAAVLEPGVRAMAVPVSVESTAGGFILPGDHVDIVTSSAPVQVPNGTAGAAGATILLKNIRVLAIDQATAMAKKDQESVIGATATLAVTPQQGEILASAKSQGQLSLMLRSMADIEGDRRPTKQQTPSVNSVKIIRNGETTEVAVQR